MYILFQFTTYICVQDISQDVISRNSSISSQPTYAYKIYPSAIPFQLKSSAHNLHMHTRYIYGPNIPIKDANAHNLHMHTRYISFFELSSSVLFRRSQPTYAYKIYHLQCNRKISVKSHNLHMHTRYIIYTDGEPYIRVTHNLHMHTRYIFVGARADATFLVSQPTYAYKIYQHLLLISNGASSSQPTYAYKIYRFHFHITVMGCITHNLHMHTRYIIK